MLRLGVPDPTSDKDRIASPDGHNRLMGQSAEDYRSAQPVCAPMGIDETHHHFDRRSSFAIAKYALALRKISLACRSSRFSRSNTFSRSAMSVGIPSRLPLSTSAFLTQSFSVYGTQPMFAEFDIMLAAAIYADTRCPEPAGPRVQALPGKTYSLSCP